MNYSGIKEYDIANGPGIRVSLFVSGCNFHCKGCFNPETWDFNYGENFTALTMKEIVDKVKSDRIAGFSLLGGDPLWQIPWDIFKLTELCKRIKHTGKSVWIWSGFTWEEIMEKKLENCETDEEKTILKYRQNLIKECDVWVDGRFVEAQRDLRLQWRGSTNQRVIDVKKSLDSNKIILYETKEII